MQITEQKLALELAGIGKQLTELSAKILPPVEKQTQQTQAIPVARPPEQVAKMVAGRLCLDCGEHFHAKKRMRRGLCGADYQSAKERFKEDPGLEERLMAAGLILPPDSKGGRPRKKNSKIDAFIAQESGLSILDPELAPATRTDSEAFADAEASAKRGIKKLKERTAKAKKGAKKE